MSNVAASPSFPARSSRSALNWDLGLYERLSGRAENRERTRVLAVDELESRVKKSSCRVVELLCRGLVVIVYSFICFVLFFDDQGGLPSNQTHACFVANKFGRRGKLVMNHQRTVSNKPTRDRRCRRCQDNPSLPMPKCLNRVVTRSSATITVYLGYLGTREYRYCNTSTRVLHDCMATCLTSTHCSIHASMVLHDLHDAWDATHSTIPVPTSYQ